jgi:uncharacterized ubiquitin-like protein YukD
MNQKILNIIDLLEKISNQAFQEQVWINQKIWNRASSLGETINLLDDYHFFEDLEAKKITLLDAKMNKLISSFVAELLEYKEPIEIREIHQDTNWLKIMSDAKVLVEEFKLKKYVIHD